MTNPMVTVVVASGAGGEFVFRCLSSLHDQLLRDTAEIVVVDRTGPATRERLTRAFPGIRVIATSAGHKATIPEMRRIGAEAARGAIVAILEEHCTASPGWLETVANAFQPGDVAVGGPIRDSRFDRVRDWVVYFSEYHNFMPPWTDGARYLLNGANIAYRRDALMKHRTVLDAGYWEVVLHPKLAQEGRFRAVDAMGVNHTGPFDYGYYLRQRYLLSRVWGGTEKDRVSIHTRLAHLLAGPVFPMFLFARVTHRVWRNRKVLRRYVAALPLLAPVWIAYAWGEWLGYLLGPGRALEEVE
jgi:glycosyltransferase involved in cell wall biosynthesis